MKALRIVGHCIESEVKQLYKYCSVSCTDRFFALRTQCIVTSHRVLFWFCLCMFCFFSLKAMGPIDCHYMSDRLLRFELKLFICVLLKKQSHLHLGCPAVHLTHPNWSSGQPTARLNAENTFHCSLYSVYLCM